MGKLEMRQQRGDMHTMASNMDGPQRGDGGQRRWYTPCQLVDAQIKRAGEKKDRNERENHNEIEILDARELGEAPGGEEVGYTHRERVL